ncbi:Forkhead box protein [Schistosoma japonicum]|nr:Forkhead box protein [Schistosoma japonicum]
MGRHLNKTHQLSLQALAQVEVCASRLELYLRTVRKESQRLNAMVRHLISRARSGTAFEWSTNNTNNSSTSIFGMFGGNCSSTCLSRCNNNHNNIPSVNQVGSLNWNNNGPMDSTMNNPLTNGTLELSEKTDLESNSVYETQMQNINSVYRTDNTIHCSPVYSNTTSTSESWCSDQLLISDCTAMSMLRDLPLQHRRSAVHALTSRWSTSNHHHQQQHQQQSTLDTYTSSNTLTNQIPTNNITNSNNNNLSPLPIFPTNPNDCSSSGGNTADKITLHQPTPNSCHPALIASAAAALLSSVSSLQNQITNEVTITTTPPLTTATTVTSLIPMAMTTTTMSSGKSSSGSSSSRTRTRDQTKSSINHELSTMELDKQGKTNDNSDKFTVLL